MNKRLFSLLLLMPAACATTSEASTTTATSAASTTTTAPTTTTTTAAASGAGEGCVVGDWTLDTEGFAATMEALMSGDGATPTVTVTSGSATLAFDAGGDATGVYDALNIQMELGSGTPVIDMILSGQIVGTWTVEGDTLVLTPGSESFLDVEALVDGESFSMPVEPDTSLSTTASAISCEGDTLTITPDVEGSAPSVWLRS